MKIYFFICLVAILVFFGPCSFAQNSTENSSGLKTLSFYAEAFGNGGFYSLNLELSKHKGHFISSDRLGFSYYSLGEKYVILDPKINYVSLLYEKNFRFGSRKLKPELGIGYTFFFFSKPIGYFKYTDSQIFRFNGDKYMVWFIPKAGLGYYSGNKWFVKCNFTPAIFVTELNEKEAKKFMPFIGVSLGSVIKTF